MSDYQVVSDSLMSAVREGRLEKVKELINSFDRSHLIGRARGNLLLCEALKHKHAAVVKLLLTSGFEVELGYGSDSYIPLELAIISGDLEIVKMILDKGAYIIDGVFGRIPLHYAIKNKKIEVIEFFLTRGSHFDRSHLGLAVEMRCLEIVEYILKFGVNCDCTLKLKQVYSSLDYTCPHSLKLKEEYTPLHFASELGNKKAVKLFLNRGDDVNACTKGDLTPLHIATIMKHNTVVRLLLQHGAKIDNQDKDGITILYLAVETRDLMIVKDVLKYCPDINNQSNRSSFKNAVQGCRKIYGKIVEALLEYGFIVKSEDANNPNLLHAAVGNGYLKIVEDLLKYGADVNIFHNSTSYKAFIPVHSIVNMTCRLEEEQLCKFLPLESDDELSWKYYLRSKDFTALHKAAKYEQEEVAKLLIIHGADINAQDDTRKTPIFYAIENTDWKITKLLLTNKANIKDNPELLNIAVEKECIEIVEALLQHGADINASDTYGRTALHFTALCESEDSFEFLTDNNPYNNYTNNNNIDIKGKIAKLLLSKGANVNSQTRYGVTTLRAAIHKGYAKVVKALLEYNANINCGVESDTTLLHLAAQKGHEEVVKALLEYGVKVDSRNKNGRTALHFASEEGHAEVAATLLEYGSDINITCNDNHTPLDYAYQRMTFIEPLIGLYDDSIGVDIIRILTYHILYMKSANIYVSEQNLLSVNDKYIKYSQYECKEEILSMKNEKINNANISFYDILAKSTSSLARYMRNEIIVQVLKSYEYEQKFPIYARIIKSRFRKAIERNKLLEEGNQIFYVFFHYFIKLPFDCTEKIFSYLSNEDLQSLMVACIPLSIDNLIININA